MTINRIGTTARWSDVVVHNQTVYTVEVATMLEGDIVMQTQEILARLERILISANSSKSRILNATIYLADIHDIDAFNAIWDSWIPAGTAPVRACVQAKLAKPEYRVEIQLTAAVCSA